MNFTKPLFKKDYGLRLIYFSIKNQPLFPDFQNPLEVVAKKKPKPGPHIFYSGLQTLPRMTYWLKFDQNFLRQTHKWWCDVIYQLLTSSVTKYRANVRISNLSRYDSLLSYD